jgi:hypothetical protein
MVCLDISEYDLKRQIKGIQQSLGRNEWVNAGIQLNELYAALFLDKPTEIQYRTPRDMLKQLWSEAECYIHSYDFSVNGKLVSLQQMRKIISNRTLILEVKVDATHCDRTLVDVKTLNKAPLEDCV